MSHDSLRRVLAALAEMHMEFWGQEDPGLCSLENRYNLLSPATGRRETAAGGPAGSTISRCWEAFGDFVPKEIATAIVELAERPAPLVAELDRCDKTLIHGDVRLTNLGLTEDKVVLVDWGERSGFAPAPVELASFLMFDAPRFAVSRDDVIADFRALYGDRVDDRTMQLGLIGGMVQLGPHPVLDYVLNPSDEAKAFAESELAWWIDKMSKALEVLR